MGAPQGEPQTSQLIETGPRVQRGAGNAYLYVIAKLGFKTILHRPNKTRLWGGHSHGQCCFVCSV